MISFQDLSLKWRKCKGEKADILEDQRKNSSLVLNSITAVLGSFSLLLGSKTANSNLIECLSGQEDIVEGSISVAGKKVNAEILRQLSAHIPSNPVLAEDMKIRDLIEFTISLRNPSVSPEKKKDLLDCFADLPLEEDASPSSLLSDADRKRLATLLELMCEVPIIFIEDSTAGMDIFEAEKYIKQLKQLAVKYPISIIIGINDSSNGDLGSNMIDGLMEAFDSVLIIGNDGKVTYNGGGKELLENPEWRGFGDLENFKPMKSSTPTPTTTTTTATTAVYPSYKRYKAPFVGQFAILLKYISPKSILNPWMHLRFLLKSVFFGVLLGLVYLDSSQYTPFAHTNHKTSALFFFSFNDFFGSCLGTIPSMVGEKEILYHNISTGMHDVGPFYLVKVVIMFPFAFLYPYLEFLIAYYMIGLNSPFSVYLFSATFIAVSSLCGSTLTMVIGGAIDSLGIVLIIATIILLLLFIVTGLFSHVKSEPVWFSWIRFISPIFYTFSGLLQNEFQGQNLPNCDPEIYGSECDGDSIIEKIEFDDSLSVGVNLTLEIVIWISLLIIGFVGHWFKVRKYK